MNDILIYPVKHNGNEYQIVNVTDFVNDSGSHDLYYDELEFVKVQKKFRIIFWDFWFTIKAYRVVDDTSRALAVNKATNLLNMLLLD